MVLKIEVGVAASGSDHPSSANSLVPADTFDVSTWRDVETGKDFTVSLADDLPEFGEIPSHQREEPAAPDADNLVELFGHDEPGLDLGLDNSSLSIEPSLAETDVLQSAGVANDQTDLLHSVTNQPVVFDTQTALQIASRSLPARPVEPVWEQGIWGVIFGDKSYIDVYKPYGETLLRPVDTSSDLT